MYLIVRPSHGDANGGTAGRMMEASAAEQSTEHTYINSFIHLFITFKYLSRIIKQNWYTSYRWICIYENRFNLTLWLRVSFHFNSLFTFYFKKRKKPNKNEKPFRLILFITDNNV